MARQLKRPRHPQANLDAETYCGCACFGAASADCLPKQTRVADSCLHGAPAGVPQTFTHSPSGPRQPWTAFAAAATATAGVVGISNRHGKQHDSGTHRHLPRHVHSPPPQPENVHVLFSQEKTEKIA